MDIEGLGEKTVGAAPRPRAALRLADIYSLDFGQIREIEGFGDVSVANLAAAIEASKARPLANLLVGLSIRHLGGTGSQVLARQLRSPRSDHDGASDELAEMEGVGPTIAETVQSFFARNPTIELIERLRQPPG